ncbi:hypothetical protein STSO111631_23750 [Stackebrandtia soli]
MGQSTPPGGFAPSPPGGGPTPAGSYPSQPPFTPSEPGQAYPPTDATYQQYAGSSQPSPLYSTDPPVQPSSTGSPEQRKPIGLIIGAITAVLVLAGVTITLGEIGVFDREPSANVADEETTSPPDADPTAEPEPGSQDGATYAMKKRLCEQLDATPVEAIAPLFGPVITDNDYVTDPNTARCDIELGDPQGDYPESLMQIEVIAADSPERATSTYDLWLESSKTTPEDVDLNPEWDRLQIGWGKPTSGSSTVELYLADGNLTMMITVDVKGVAADQRPKVEAALAKLCEGVLGTLAE